MALDLRGADNRLDPDSLFRLTQKVAAAVRPEEIYEAALICLRDTLGVQRSSILLFDGGVMRFKAWLGLSAEYRKAVEGHSPWRMGEINARPILVEDASKDPSLQELLPVLQAESIGALAFVPLTIGGRLLGKFMLYYDDPHEFAPEESLFAETIASHIAFAIDQQAARDQQLHLDAIFRSAATGIAEIDTSGVFKVVNERFCEIVGRTREELLSGLTAYEITHPDDRVLTSEGFKLLREGAEHLTFEKRYLRPDGSVRWVSNNVSSIRDESGKLQGAVAVVMDIEERRRAEEELRRSEERYRELVGALGLAVYTTDAEGRITMYNEAAAELWGRRPELHKDLWCGSWRIFNPDGSELPSDQCPLAVTLRENRPVRDVEIIVQRPDGSRAWVQPYPTPLHDSFGQLKGAVNVLVDITSRKVAEEAALYRSAIIDSSDDAIVSKDLTGIVTSWNSGAQKIFGYTAEEMVGRSIRTIIPDDRQEEEEDILARLSRGESIEHFETIRVRKDGQQIAVSVTISPVRDRAGRIIGASKIARDISDRRRMEEAMQESIALKDQFLGLVSHELRTPIATIYGNGLLLLRREEQLQPEDKKQAISDIVSEAGKLQSIIENLLLITRLEAGRLDSEPLAMAPLVEESIAEFQKMFPSRTVTFTEDEDVPPAVGQQTLVSLVLRNLLSNAEKYSSPDTSIEVHLRRNEAGSPEIAVRDHGIGLDETARQNLFVPFFRAQKARIQAKGMGLGLAVCKRVVEAHGGTIAATEAVEDGTEFVFSLPRIESDAAEIDDSET